MEIEFTLQKAELVDFMMRHRKGITQLMLKRVGKPVIPIWVIVSLAIMAAGMWWDKNWFAVPVVFLAFLLWILAFIKYFTRRSAEILYTDEFFGELLAPQKIIMDATSVTNIKQTSKSEYLWNAISEIVHSDKATLLLLPSKAGLIVPHRVFRNSTEIQSFKDELESLWKKGKNHGTTLLNASAN
jgi:hypothetical protein